MRDLADWLSPDAYQALMAELRGSRVYVPSGLGAPRNGRRWRALQAAIGAELAVSLQVIRGGEYLEIPLGARPTATPSPQRASRDAALRRMRLDGATLHEIAQQIGLSRRQIRRRLGP